MKNALWESGDELVKVLKPSQDPLRLYSEISFISVLSGVKNYNTKHEVEKQKNTVKTKSQVWYGC